MSYKCKKHKSNEGFNNPDDNNKWKCWLCFLTKAVKISQSELIAIVRQFLAFTETLEDIDEISDHDEFSTRVLIRLNKYNVPTPFYIVFLEISETEFGRDGEVVDESEPKFECIKTLDIEEAYKYFNKWESEHV